MAFLIYCSTRIFIRLIGLLPFNAVFAFADALFWVGKLFRNYRQAVVLKNLHTSFPNLDSRQIEQMKDGFYRHFFDLVLETIKGFTLPKAELQRRFFYKNTDVFKPYFDKKQSIILLGSHYGNWEWGVLSFPLAVEHKVVGIYKELKNKWLDDYLSKTRCRFGLTLTPMMQAGRAVLEQKQQPSIFVLIADQTPSDVRNCHWATFLGQDTPFLQGADKLARKTGFPVFYFEINKVRRGQYEVEFSCLTDKPQTLQEGQVTAGFAARLEKTILEKPTDWLWSHNRWKRKRPHR